MFRLSLWWEASCRLTPNRRSPSGEARTWSRPDRGGGGDAGTAAAGSLANGTTTSIGAGFAASSPAGGISTGLGASVGQSNAVSGAASIGNGAAITSGISNNIGVGVGGGFTNVLP